MVKLSQQLVSDRLTRTERVREKQATERAKKSFLQLKERAKVKQEELSDLTSIEEYREQYDLLDPELKPFFTTPQTLTSQKQDRIEENRTKVKEAQAKAQQDLNQKKAMHDQQMEDARIYYSEHREKGEWYRDKVNQIADKWDEDQMYHDGLVGGYNKGLQQLDQGKDLRFVDIRSYALNVAYYERDRQRAENRELEFKREQQAKIEDLQEQGYKAFLIEKSYKGKTEEAYLEFYKAGTGDWQRVATFQAPKQVSTLDFAKSKLGMVEIERSLFIGKKEFKFKTHLQLYKDPSGILLTKYGSIGKSEDVIIKEARDVAYADWLEKQPKTKEAKIVQVKEEAVISEDRKWYDKSIEELFLSDVRQKAKRGASFIWEKVKIGYEKIPSSRWSYSPFILGGSGLTPYKTKFEKDIDVTARIEKGREYLGKVSADVRTWAYGKEKLTKLDLELSEKYQTQYQTIFERKYMKDLIYEATTFEKASKEFEKSEEAKLLQVEYEKEYGVKYKEISQSATLGKKLAGGSAMAGLGLGQLGLGLIKTPKSAVLTAGGVYVGLGVLKAIPPHVVWGTTTGLFAYGTYKAFSPISTVEEAGGGLVTATISGAFLGYGAIRYLKSPVIKTVKIKPKISVKTGKVIGIEQPKVVFKDIYGKITIKEVTKYPKTLSRQVIAGRRTIVTTKGRQLFRLDPLYRGVPTKQLGYQKSLTKLTKYGYTPAQAKATLRYYSPRIIETEISGVNILTYGEKIKPFAVSKTTVIKRQPIKVVSERLGIKTRGARTIKEVYISQKSIIKEIKEYTLIKEISTKTTGFLTEKGGWYQKLTQAGKTSTKFERTILAKASDIKIGYLKTRVGKMIVGREFKYQSLKEYFVQRQILPLKYQRLFGIGKVKLIKTGKVRYIDESELTGIKIKELIRPRKAPKVRTIGEMSAKELKVMIKDLQDIYGKGSPIRKISRKPFTKDVQKVMEKLDVGDVSKLKTVDKYYGTGLYERTEGGLAPQKLDQMLRTDVLKQIRTPDLKAVKIKDLIKIKQVDKLGIKMASLTGTKYLLDLRAEPRLKMDLKAKAYLKNLLRTDTTLKQQTKLKQQSALKQALKLSLNLETISTIPHIPLLEIPITPTQIKTPRYKPPIIPLFLLKGRVQKKLLKKKKIGQEFAYLPDFTTRALGLDPDVITGKQAQARIKKILTGLEIRRGVIIK